MDCAPATRNCMQTERKKNRRFRRLGWIPAIKGEGRDREVWGSGIRCRVEMRENIRNSATRWAEDDSTIGLGIARYTTGTPLGRGKRSISRLALRLIGTSPMQLSALQCHPDRLLRISSNEKAIDNRRCMRRPMRRAPYRQ
jgi:hypothetical protein